MSLTTRLLIIAGAALGIAAVGARIARADDIPPPIDNGDVVNPINIISGAGIKVGEGSVLHPQAGLDLGYISNVFYESSNPTGSGILRVLLEAGLSSLSAQRLQPNDASTPQRNNVGSFVYDLNGFLEFDQYLTGNEAVLHQGGFSGGVLARGTVNPNKPVQFQFLEQYNRLIRATNFESRADLDRDVNALNLRLLYQPEGRSLGGYAYYINTLDLFEDKNQRFADRFMNTVGARLIYQWLPLTRFYLDVSESVDTGVGDTSTKATAYPLVAVVGAQTALTSKTALNARVGYTQGFYSAGPSYQTVVGGVELDYKYSPVGQASLLYSYDHADSINANFYRDHLIRASIEQSYAPFSFYVAPELRFRLYDGVTQVVDIVGPDTRTDTIFDVNAGVRYMFKDWIAGVINYNLTVDSTDYRYTTVGDHDPATNVNPSYTRHEIMLGVRATY
ncbi:MAG TPA: hypothetical protein VGM88_14170 [Kofleriaceae bacterium]